MKILCEFAPCAPAFVRAGWLRVFKACGHAAEFWNPSSESAHDAFARHEPDIFLGTTENLSRAVRDCVRARPQMKVALYASAWGELADAVPDSYPISRASTKERRSVESLKNSCGKPDFVFSHLADARVDGVLGGWREAGVEPRGVLLGGDVLAYPKGTRREEFLCDAAMVGGFWGYKAQRLRPYVLPLCHPDSGLRIKIFGNQPWPVANFLGPLDAQDEADLYASASVCLNVHEPHSAEFGYDVNERNYKVPICGGFLLSDKVEDLKEVFGEGSIVVADGPAEYAEAVRHYAAHPEERAPFIEAARRDVLKGHTYFHRVAQILSLLGLPGEADGVLGFYDKLGLK